MFQALKDFGITSRAFHEAFVDLTLWNPRDFTSDAHRTVDDRPYGGGPGMIMRADVLAKAFHEGVMIPGGYQNKNELTVIYTSPRGVVWDNKVAREFGEKILVEKDIVLICGRYEGIDERFIENYVDQIYSIGDYVLTGGELAVMTLLDSSVRFVPGILGNK
jgi:tRNA (guanine37-N1)-methyltransferase